MVLVLSGEELDETGGRAVFSAIALSLAALSGAAGHGLTERRPELAGFGLAVVASALAALAATLWAIWIDEGDDEAIAKLAGSLAIAAFAGGHASLILGGRRRGEPAATETVRVLTLVALASLSVLGIAALTADFEEWRLLGVLGIGYVLGTLLIPLTRGGAGGRAASAADPPAGLDHVVIAVSDRARSDRFYSEVLGAEIVPRDGGRVAYRLGSAQLDVQAPGDEPAPLPRVPAAPGGADLCVRWRGPIEEAMAHLRRHGIAPVAGPVERDGAGGRGTSVYFTDPDGGLLELISYSDSGESPAGANSSAQPLMQ